MRMKLSNLTLTDDLQCRTSSDEAYFDGLVAHLSENIGNHLPAIDAIREGSTCWVYDGNYRVRAYREAGRKDIEVNVKIGTFRDALLLSLKANSTHGLPRSNADKRRAVEIALKDAEWGKMSDRVIAKMCEVSHTFVSENRSLLATLPVEPKIGEDGKERKPKPKPDLVPKSQENEESKNSVPNGQQKPQENSTPEPEPKGPCDDFGTPVSAELAELFSIRELWGKARHHAAITANIFNQLEDHPAYRTLEGDAETRLVFSSYFHTAVKQLDDRKPVKICATCKGVPTSEENDPCNACEGKLYWVGWEVKES